MEFGPSGRAHDFQNQYYVSSERPGYLKCFEENPKPLLKNMIMGNLKIWKIEYLKMLRKTGVEHLGDSPNFFENLEYDINIFQKHEMKSW